MALEIPIDMCLKLPSILKEKKKIPVNRKPNALSDGAARGSTGLPLDLPSTSWGWWPLSPHLRHLGCEMGLLLFCATAKGCF